MRGTIELNEGDDLHYARLNGHVCSYVRCVMKEGSNVDYLGVLPYSTLTMNEKSHCDLLYVMERGVAMISGQVNYLFLFPGAEVTIMPGAYVTYLYKIRAEKGHKYKAAKCRLSTRAYLLNAIQTVTDTKAKMLMQQASNNVVEWGVVMSDLPQSDM